MPIAVLSCQPSFAKSSTATTVVRSRWSNSKMQNSSHPYYNLNYIELQKDSTYYSGKNYTTNNFPDEPTRCTINSISIGFRGVTVNSSGNGSTSTSYIPTIQVEGYNSSGVSTGSLTITPAMFTGDNSAATGNKLRTFSFTSGLPTNWLNKDNLYTIKFIVTGHFSLWGTDSDGAVSNFTITIDYTEPPKPSFTNAPVLRVNNVTSSTSYTANLSWTKATLSEGFESYQNSVIYLILENGNQIGSTSSLSYTYTKQSSSQILLAIKPSLTYLGTQYTGDSSNLVSYTFTPFKVQPSNLLVNGEIESHYYQCKLNWTAAQVIDGYSVSYELFINDAYSGDTTSTSYTWDDGSSLAPRKTFKIIAYASNGTLDFYSSYTNSVSYTYIPNGLVKAITLDSYQAYSTSWDGAQEPTIIAWYFNKGDTVYVDLSNRKYHDGYYLCYNTNGLAGYIAKIYLDIPKNTLYYYNNGWQFCYVYRYNGTKWEPCIVYYYASPSEGWKQCQ